jgi:endonuclease/exonuclease/phosphatase family metal-dependent hydrolase
MKKIGLFVRVLLGLLILGLVLGAAVWATTFHPAAVQVEVPICPAETPQLRSGQVIKVLTWNIQFMAGKGYVFWVDVPTNDGPDVRPSAEAVTATLSEVARVIRAEAPDIIYLQEVDKGAAHTDYRDELGELLQLIPEYGCSVQSYYWKNSFVPHPKILGSTGMTLVILSKFKIDSATRYQLALPPADPLTQQMGLKRAILDAHLPIAGGGEFHAITTHLDAFAQGNNTMDLQVQAVDTLLGALEKEGRPWVIGGDFNLLPPEKALQTQLAAGHQSYYNPESEIKRLYDRYAVIPSAQEASGAEQANWYTYLPNDPAIPYLDRTLDYLFFAKNVSLGAHSVRQGDTQRISDHMPVIGVFTLP